ncbi:antibiotic biosynthesis monooxygenase [Actinomadura vinacea]|uniref:Antibiotic biosynthesis monooxygenase n=2 Tax=Actinomadura vinacea TaxID=115336 RepID=A0ABN3JHP5_9ACTN
MSSEWTVHSPQRQRKALDLQAEVWGEADWPEGLHSYTFYAGTDGSTILHYSQWRDDQAYRDFVESGRKPRMERVDAAVPGIERHDLAFYRLHRSLTIGSDEPGIVVTEFVAAGGPDDARRRVGTMADAREKARPSGLLTAGFHVSSDGSRILDYSEWTDDAAFEAYLAPQQDTGSRRIKRFRPYRSLRGA